MQHIPEDLAKALGAIKYYCKEFDCGDCPLSVKLNTEGDLDCVLTTTAPWNIEIRTEYSYTIKSQEVE